MALCAAERAAEILRRYYQTGVTARHKGAVDLLTQADIEAQAAIVGTIEESFPSHAILAEEGDASKRPPSDGPLWVVDPLDGTTNFTHGLPFFSTSIAFLWDGRGELGLVFLPLSGEVFLARRGSGATMNGRRIKVSACRDLGTAALATGFPYDRRTSPDNNLSAFCHFELRCQCVRRFGVASIDLAHVACGRLDGFWEAKLAPWDVAAGILLVEEAGGLVTDFGGEPLTDLWKQEIIATNGALHGDIREGLRLCDGQNITLDPQTLRLALNDTVRAKSSGGEAKKGS